MIPDMVRMTRAAIGLKADGSIVTFTTHGISDQSSGHTVPEMASLLAAAGCVTAINLDGAEVLHIWLDTRERMLRSTQ